MQTKLERLGDEEARSGNESHKVWRDGFKCVTYDFTAAALNVKVEAQRYRIDGSQEMSEENGQ